MTGKYLKKMLEDLKSDDSEVCGAAAKVKVECSRRTSDLLTLAMEVCGGVACFDEFGLSRHHRDLFVCRVGEGSNFALKGFATRPLMPGITLD